MDEVDFKFRLNGREVNFFDPRRNPEDGGDRGEEELVSGTAVATGPATASGEGKEGL